MTDKAKATMLGSEQGDLWIGKNARTMKEVAPNPQESMIKAVPLIHFSGYKYIESLTHHKKIVQVELKKKTHGENINLRTIVSEKAFKYASAASWRTAQVLHFIRVLTLCRTLALFEKHFINTDTQHSSI